MHRILLLLPAVLPLAAQSSDFFETRVRPVLAANCYSCHSAKAKTPFAGLLLDSRAAMLKGGDHGPVLVPGKPAESRLLQAIRWEGYRMPPAGKLPADQVDAIAKWIAEGAPWPEEKTAAAAGAAAGKGSGHWAWQPLRSGFAPDSSIDGFVRAGLDGLTQNSEADRPTLIRRLSHDLTGLPPSAAAIDAFVAGESYEALVNRLLASPRFGERWARHWLDLARFSDAGFNNVRFPYAFTYRDWVIAAFNEDMPYRDFVERQLAADQLPGAEPRHLAALGFLSLGYNAPRQSNFPEKVDDRIDTVSRTFLGLTVACARCHDHKYDPIPTKDYYSLYGVFANTHEPIDPLLIEPGKDSPFDAFYLPKLSRRREIIDEYKRQRIEEIRAEARQPEAVKRYLAAAWESRAMTNPQVDALSKERNLNLLILRRWREWLGGFKGEFDAPRLAAELTASGFLAQPEAPPTVPLEDFVHVLTEGDYNTTNNLRWQRDRIFADYAFRGSPARAMHVLDNARMEPAHVLIRGNQNDVGDTVPRQFLSLIAGATRRPFEQGAGRLDLARAITHPANPLTARVYVNRVWMHLFGEGLVRTPSDFGLRGESPTHPELLDWLAAAFVEQDGWSTRKLIRRIVMSAAYRQSSSGANQAARARDPDNRRLWRQNRRRMDFEALRDAMLVAAGKLDSRIGGPSFSLAAVPADPRRTMYAYVEREKAQAVLKAFDSADPEQHTPQRHQTTVPQQSLFLLNSPFVMEMAGHAAARSASVRELYRNVLGRDGGPEQADGKPAAHVPPAVWQYGYGHLDPAAGKVVSFTPFRYFVDGTWQASSLLPDREAGNAMLTANGGAPGDGLQHAAIRRWRSNSAGRVSIKATLTHTLDQFTQRFKLTNGIRAHVVHSRLGVLGKWSFGPPEESAGLRPAAVRKVETNLDAIEVRGGDTIDFVVDSLDDYEADSFAWAPVLRAEDGAESDAARDFSGPTPVPLSPYGELAQVLLLTNEFTFID